MASRETRRVIAAHVEMIGGASGNMLLGALVDAGADLGAIEAALRTIPVDAEWRVGCTRVVKRGIAAAHLVIDVPGEDHDPQAPPQTAAATEHAHHRRHAAHTDDHDRDHGDAGGHDYDGSHPHGHAGPRSGRTLSAVLAIVARSGLSERQKARTGAIYRRLGEAEARVHGSSVDEIHFHEVGAVDAILDVAGVCVALDLLGVERLTCSPYPIGRGSISMHHGRYPNPPPATAELMRGAPTYDAGIDGEMVTTTGAAILSTLVERPGARPALRIARIGYGAGRSEFPIPNVVRVLVGDLLDEPADAVTGGRSAVDPSTGAEIALDDVALDAVAILEANVDDMSPQHFELALERLFGAGALDAWLAPISMKKSRPGVLVSAIVPLDREAACARTLLEETTTLGVRVRRERRYVLRRGVETFETEWGSIRVKTAHLGSRRRRTLEYDDVVRIARERGRPIAEIADQLERALPPL